MSRMFILAVLASILAGGTADAAVVDGTPARQQLVYKVHHSRYGTLGTYTNTIERNGDTTNIATVARLSVSILGISFFSQTISRLETWRGNRIVGFHGVTTTNGQTVELSGKAEGDHFAMTTPLGTLIAPADVRFANPWSREAIEGETMLTPDRGRLEMVMLSGTEPEMLTIGGRSLRTEHLEVLRGGGPRRYEVWLDEQGIPVQFSLVSPDNAITFTLGG